MPHSCSHLEIGPFKECIGMAMHLGFDLILYIHVPCGQPCRLHHLVIKNSSGPHACFKEIHTIKLQKLNCSKLKKREITRKQLATSKQSFSCLPAFRTQIPMKIQYFFPILYTVRLDRVIAFLISLQLVKIISNLNWTISIHIC